MEEETGVGQLELKKFLLQTLHEYEELGKVIQKKTHVSHVNDQSSVTDPANRRRYYRFKMDSTCKFEIVLRNTYPAIVEVLRAGGYFSVEDWKTSILV